MGQAVLIADPIAGAATAAHADLERLGGLVARALALDRLKERCPDYDVSWLHQHGRGLSRSITDALGRLGKLDETTLSELLELLDHLEQLVAIAHNAKRAETTRDKKQGESPAGTKLGRISKD